MSTRQRVFVGAAFLWVLSFLTPTQASAYGWQTALDYNGQLFGFTTTWKDGWDEDVGGDCNSWVWDPEYEEWYCESWLMWETYVVTHGWLYGPDEELYASGSAEHRWQAGFDLNPFTPDGPGTWELDGNHYQKEYLYQDSGWGWEFIGTNQYLMAQTRFIVTITCGDPERDLLIAEYRDYNVNLMPACADLTHTRGTVNFPYHAIAITNEFGWGLVRDPLIAAQSSGYGLEAWQAYIGYGPRHINSGYRNPHRNSTQGGAPQSRHMYGDAADFNNSSGTSDEYWTMYNAGWSASADFVEDPSGPCAMVCTHADWRGHGGGYR